LTLIISQTHQKYLLQKNMKLINIRSLLCVVAAANILFVGINASNISGKNLEDPPADAAVGAPAVEEPMQSDIQRLYLDIRVLPDDGGLTDLESGNLRRRNLQEVTCGDTVLLCRHYDCQGGSVHVGEGRYMEMPWEIGDNELSRAFIPVGYSIEYYEHYNLGGWSNTVGGGDRCIDLYMRGHEDSVSSFVIHRAANKCDQCNSCQCDDNCDCIVNKCDQCNFCQCDDNCDCL
jgi:hypothetical protein